MTLIFISMNGGFNMTNNQENLTESQQEDIVKDIEEKLATNRAEGLKLLRSYDHHESEDLKWEILGMVWQFGLNSSDSLMRQELVIYMLDILAKETPFLQGQAVKFLQDYYSSDFNEYADEKLTSLSWSGEYGAEIIRLIGIADVRAKTHELRKISSKDWQDIESDELYGSCQWTASLVCARFGDMEITKRVIERVKSEPDIILRTTVLFRDLAFTQQQLAFDALRDFLHSKDHLPELKETDPGMPEALFAAQIFVYYAEGCPGLDTAAKENELERITRWADAQVRWNFILEGNIFQDIKVNKFNY
jgi:hypothetical protein